MYYLYSKSYLKDTDRMINNGNHIIKLQKFTARRHFRGYNLRLQFYIQGTDRADPCDLTQVLQQILGQDPEPMSNVLYTTHINRALQSKKGIF